MDAIIADSIVKEFGQVRALDGVSVEIAAGELFFLLGASGCGKTTLLRCIAGLETPTSGRVLFGSRDVTQLPPHKREAAMVFQSYALWPHLSVEKNIAFGLEERGVAKDEIRRRVGEALELVHLGKLGDRGIDQLSGGQQQRVALARALVVRPKCLLLDEPLSNLDAKLRIEMRREIRRIVKEGGLTGIYVTHDQEEALSMADRMAVLNAGRIEQLGTAEDVYRNPLTAFVSGFIGETNLIPGKIVEANAERAVVETAGVTLTGRITRPEWSPSAGTAVQLSIRPEAWNLTAGANSIRGRIAERAYLGQTIQYVIETAAGRQQVVELNPDLVREPGSEEVTLSAKAADIAVLRPESLRSTLMLRRFIPLLLLLAAVIAAPIVLRQESALATAGQGEDRLVILTPHNETIRSAFGEAFARYWKDKTGRSLYIDWRTPGGTSDIKRVLDSAYAAADALHNPGVGVDLFFGGGQPDFDYQVKAGHFAPAEVFTTHPEWFRPEVIPEYFTGERYYDAAHLWVGACVSQMGICYNTDSLACAGLPEPRRWDDLGDPAYAGYLALADPTKSGSVNRTYELMIQQQMQESIARLGDTPEAREEGWRKGLNLLQRLAANARYFTDSAVKVTLDVSQGDAIAGNCIDFYGRSFQEKLERHGVASRLRWIAPDKGTSLSADPVAMLRGAPHAEIAQAFITFCLSDEGQLLWDVKADTPGGPRHASPRRLPIRRDLYTPENLARFSDPMNPFESSGSLIYDKKLTGSAFSAISAIFRAMCMDPQDELRDAWQAIHAPGAHDTAQAEAALLDVSHVSYDQVMNSFVPLLGKKDPLMTSREIARISGVFRANYLRAAEIARKGARP